MSNKKFIEVLSDGDPGLIDVEIIKLVATDRGTVFLHFHDGSQRLKIDNTYEDICKNFGVAPKYSTRKEEVE